MIISLYIIQEILFLASIIKLKCDRQNKALYKQIFLNFVLNQEEIMKIIFSMLILFFLYDNGFNQHFYSQNFANTYSIVAVDSITGEIGAAVQSHWFSVGSNVIWAEAGVGAVATQSFINPSFGFDGLKLMNEGRLPQEALSLLVNNDEGRDFRQVALINADGISAAHTGVKCIPDAGHMNGKYFSAQANLMLKASVWPAMVDAFKKTKGPLAERLVASLEAAQKEGGDIRGKQSAAILVVRGISTGKIWKDRLIDIRVEDHPDPVKELKRLLRIHRAYEHMNAGDVAIETGDEQKALLEYGKS
jgi:uncharacterized Ntn-hydrolase superfamily protein